MPNPSPPHSPATAEERAHTTHFDGCDCVMAVVAAVKEWREALEAWEAARLVDGADVNIPKRNRMNAAIARLRLTADALKEKP